MARSWRAGSFIMQYLLATPRAISSNSPSTTAYSVTQQRSLAVPHFISTGDAASGNGLAVAVGLNLSDLGPREGRGVLGGKKQAPQIRNNINPGDLRECMRA